MFYPVKVRDASGKIKKVVSSRQLSRDYWKQFDNILGGEMKKKRTKDRPRQRNDEEEMGPEEISE